MNKSQLAEALAAKNGNLTAAQAVTVINDLTEIITRQAALDDKVTIPGFGTFGSRAVAEQTRRNPFTGESFVSPAKRKPTFKPGKDLLAAVAGGVPIAAAGA